MINKRVPLSVELPIGYFDRKDDFHSSATIGRALTARDFFAVKDEWQLGGDFLVNVLILQRAITALGSLPIPVPMGDLLALDSLDFEHLTSTYNEFADQCGRPEIVNQNTVKLVFGVSVKGAVFDVVELGAEVTAAHLSETRRRRLGGVAALAYIVSREVLNLRDSESGRVIAGPLAFDDLLAIDCVDLFPLLKISDFYQSSMARIAQVMGVSIEEATARIGKPDAAVDAAIDKIAGRSNN